MNDEAKRKAALPVWWVGLFALAAFGLRTVTHGSVWMHLAAGRWISEHGVPRNDPFSFTAEGERWVNLSWLYDRLLFSLHNIGMPLIVLAHVAAVVVAFLLLGRVARRYAGPVSMSLAVLLAGWLMAPEFRVSPEVFSLVFPAILIAVLSRGAPGWLAMPILAATQILWTNFSMTFLVGPMIGGAFAVAEFYRRRTDEDSDEVDGLPRYLVATALLIVACFVSPYGPRAPLHAASHLFGASAIFSLEQTSPFAFLVHHPLPGQLNALALAIGAGGLLTYRKRLPMGLTLVAVLGAVFSLSGRHPNLFPRTHLLFPMLAFPFLALSLSAIGEALTARGPLSKPGAAALLGRVGETICLLIALFTVGALATNHYYRFSGQAASMGARADTQMVPAAAVELLGREDFPQPLLHLHQDAGFLAWQAPHLKLFVDTRPGVQPRELHKALLRAIGGDTSAWNALLDEWRPASILLNATAPESGPLAGFLAASEDWEPVYMDGTSVVFLRPDAAAGMNADQLRVQSLQTLEARRQKLRQQLRNPLRAPFSGAMLGASHYFYHVGRLPQAEAAAELVTQMLPCLREGWAMLGSCRLQAGDAVGAVEALQVAVRNEERNPRTWQLLSVALEQQGDPAAAQEAADRASAITGKTRR